MAPSLVVVRVTEDEALALLPMLRLAADTDAAGARRFRNLEPQVVADHAPVRSENRKERRGHAGVFFKQPGVIP